MSVDDHVARYGRPRRGPRDGNDRIARIARFLCANRTKSPAMAVELVLTATVAGADPDVLARWQKEDVNPNLAPEINELIEDYANDNGTTCGATLAWVLEDGRPHLSKGFRAKCSEEDQEVVRPMDGTMQGTLAQTQRHLEATMQVVVQLAGKLEQRDSRIDDRFERVLTLYESTIDKISDRLVTRESELEAQRAETEHAAGLAEQAIERAEAAEKQAADAEQGDALGKVVEIASKQLMSGGGTSK